MTDQILLEEPDTAFFVQHVRRQRLRSYLSDLGYRAGNLLRRTTFIRRSRPWLAQPLVIASAFACLGFGVTLCFLAAMSGGPPGQVYSTSPLPPAKQASVTVESQAALAVSERVLDSEPRGAKVYRAGDLLGTTPFLYDTPPSVPLGAVRLQLEGYATEARFIGANAPRLTLVPLRRR